MNSTVLPKALKRKQPELYRSASMFLHANKMLFWQQQQASMAELITKSRDEFKKGMGNCENDVYNFVKQLTVRFGNKELDETAIKTVETEIESFIELYGKEDVDKVSGDQTKKEKKTITSTARSNLESIVNRLRSEASRSRTEVPAIVSISIPMIVEWLNDPREHGLLIIQAHDPEELREFAATLTRRAYESRRKTGQITPLVSFVFDEADEFIPGQPTSDSQKSTKAAAMSIARRGRKFGLGIGIATQRIRYLDTSILAQPHTYFVSKLPRLTDRQAIAEAFGISEDMFRQTFKFKKGDWLLASYDAAGLEAIPIPIHAENADDKILSFVEKVAKEKNH